MADGTSGHPGRVVPSPAGAVVYGSFRFDDEKAVLHRDGDESVLPPRAVGALAARLTPPGEHRFIPLRDAPGEYAHLLPYDELMERPHAFANLPGGGGSDLSERLAARGRSVPRLEGQSGVEVRKERRCVRRASSRPPLRP